MCSDLTKFFTTFRSEEDFIPKKLSSLAGIKCIPLPELKKQPAQENYYETGSESEDDIPLTEQVIFLFHKPDMTIFDFLEVTWYHLIFCSITARNAEFTDTVCFNS